MRRIVGCLALCAVGVMAAGDIPAGVRGSALPPRYAPNSLDGALIVVSSPLDGSGWAAWAYRSGAEYDIALSFTDSNGSWQAPMFVGANDRRNQIQPSLAADSRGTIYLAFVDGPARRLLLSTLPAGGTEWSPAVPVTGPETRASWPVLKVVGNRVILAYNSAGQTRVTDFPILGDGGLTDRVSEGPDPFDQRPPGPDAEPPPPPSNDGATKSPTKR